MNLTGKNTDELAQLRADIQNSLLALSEQLRVIGESEQRIKMKMLELEKEKTETAWLMRLKRREYADTKIKLDMIENAYWSQRRGNN